ncbi:MAG: VWA domain-containing protein [Muribaculaceae bacterium]|nr:VWA domain-containing protein [Muribaculaceae bacterium]
MNAKTYNIIILDKSGSMSCVRKETVDNVNEILGSIRSSQEKNAEVEQVVTLVAFCGCEIKTLIDAQPVSKVDNISFKSYQTCCTTPLYDAIGMTITKLQKRIIDEENAAVAVTVITDGYENSSHEYSRVSIKALIDAYKEKGWMFAYIGADHDVESVAFSLSIDNALRFKKTGSGMKEMQLCLCKALSDWDEKMHDIDMTPEKRKECSKSFFDKF